MSKPNSRLPYNTLPSIPPKVDFKDQELLLATLEASDAVAQLKTMLTLSDRSVANTLDLLSPLFVPEAVSSSGIENIITTNSSVYEAQILEERQLSPAEKEAINYTDALFSGTESIFKNQLLVTNDYLRLQRILEPDKPDIRKLPGTQLRDPVTNIVYYTPPEGEARIRDLLKNYEDYFNESAPSHEIFARMAVLHYQFEAIHPFQDGNGRTGRMLMPLYLMKQGKLPLPILFISRYILEHRDEYYRRLREVTYRGKWKEWILYVINATTHQAAYTGETLGQIRKATKEVHESLRKLPTVNRTELADFLFSHVYFTHQSFEEALGISYVTARKYLRVLEKEKIILKRKQTGRNRYLYITPRYISILKQV